MKKHCPACGCLDTRSFFFSRGIPVHSVINLPGREEALAFPRGDLDLAFCAGCGFIYNRLFDPTNMHYCSQCEETQGFSATFRDWHRKLAEKIVDRYDLRNKTILEIGCGKGEFLTMLCEMTGNRGVGFDPAYVPERENGAAGNRVEFVQDLYSEKYSSYQADFVCCKMTLEHIDEPLHFLQTIRRSIGSQTACAVFFQVPDIRRVLGETAFWDVYYEHCSYFSLGSLARTFRRAGFEVLDLTYDYDGQYIMIDALPAQESTQPRLPAENDLAMLGNEVKAFEEKVAERIAYWRQSFANWKGRGSRVVLWGSGSKAVSFLSAIGSAGAIEYVVDINPHRQGTYMAGNGQKVVSPEFLIDYRPEVVLVMNEIYLKEIGQDLARLGLNPELRAVRG